MNRSAFFILENRVAKNEEDLEIVNNIIDFSKVNRIMEEERNKSYGWLKKALEG